LILQSCAAAAPQAAAAAVESSGFQEQQQQWQQRQQQRWHGSWQPVVGELSLTAAAPAIEDNVEEEDLQEIEDDIMAQVAIPQELTDFMQMMQQVSYCRRLQLFILCGFCIHVILQRAGSDHHMHCVACVVCAVNSW
jgi:choline dehydrogenase-like flavoprotein